MKSIHIGIRQQLTIFVLLVVGISVTIFAIVTGVNTTNYVVNLRGERLSMVAELKASQVVQAFMSLYYQVSWLSNREQVQSALSRYRAGNRSESNWHELHDFFNSTLGTYSVMLGVGLYTTSFDLVFNQTNNTIGSYSTLDPILFPLQQKQRPKALEEQLGVVAGPSQTDPDHLMSITLPILQNTTLIEERSETGYLTLVVSSNSIQKVVREEVGLDPTSTMSLVETVPNYLNLDELQNPYNLSFRYLFSPTGDDNHQRMGQFPLETIPSIATALLSGEPGTDYNTHTVESGDMIIGYAPANLSFANWVVLVEEPKSRVYKPINRLKAIVISTSFGLAVFIVIVTIPLAHYAVRPIYRLRHATEQTKLEFHRGRDLSDGLLRQLPANQQPACSSGRGSLKQVIKKWFNMRAYDEGTVLRKNEDTIAIPNTVPLPRRLCRDELTDLSETFNNMSNELVKQYLFLEDRVSERTKEEEAARQAAEEANEKKSTFIASITHELRTPLNGILGMTAVSLTERDPSKIKRSLHVIRKSGNLLTNLLTDLLTYSKNQIGGLQLDEKEFMLSDIYQNLRTMYEAQAAEKGIKFNVVTPLDSVTLMVLYGDSSRILQVMCNLVSNALKFTPADGTVTVHIRNTGEVQQPSSSGSRRGSKQSLNPSINTTNHQRQSSVNRNIGTLFEETRSVRSGKSDQGSTGSKSSIRESIKNFTNSSSNQPTSQSLSVSRPAIEHPRDFIFDFEVVDTGPGIAESAQTTIFEPFVQGDQALSRKHGGTGLGLAICKELAHLTGGDILVSSKLDEGSKFTLRVPLKMTRLVASPEGSLLSRNNSVKSSAMSPLAEMAPNEELERSGSVSSRKSESYFPQAYQTAHHLRSDSNATRYKENVRVLVAEDNVVNQEIVKRMLRLEGITDITLAVDGERVVEKVEEAIKDGVFYDIVFMDIQMPKLNGLEATKFMRGTLGYPYTIIAMTAYADKGSENECIEAGMNGVVTKPIIRSALHKILRDYCPGAPLHEPALTPDKQQAP